ncbi:galactose-1-phosphate uridylyltransferase [Halanaerobaculum tunisiense]
MSEIRENIITGEYVVIASKRGKRPHDFEHGDQATSDGGYCPFCYGNEADTPEEIMAISDDPDREANKSGWRIRVVPNKFAALDIDQQLETDNSGFYNQMTGVGAAEVLIESAEHDSTLGGHSRSQIADVISVLQQRHEGLAQDERLKYIQTFKNFGGTAGASLEHPHWQIMATPVVPNVIDKELTGTQNYYQQHGDCVYCEMIDHELEVEDRIIATNDQFVVFNPYASRYPFETWILPHKHQSDFREITAEQIEDLAQMLQKMVRKIEVGFDSPPYNIILHTAPLVKDDEVSYHWHIEILPRLSITAGFELGTGNFINPTPPEVAADALVDINVE